MSNIVKTAARKRSRRLKAAALPVAVALTATAGLSVAPVMADDTVAGPDNLVGNFNFENGKNDPWGYSWIDFYGRHSTAERSKDQHVSGEHSGRLGGNTDGRYDASITQTVGSDATEAGWYLFGAQMKNGGSYKAAGSFAVGLTAGDTSVSLNAPATTSGWVEDSRLFYHAGGKLTVRASASDVGVKGSLYHKRAAYVDDISLMNNQVLGSIEIDTSEVQTTFEYGEDFSYDNLKVYSVTGEGADAKKVLIDNGSYTVTEPEDFGTVGGSVDIDVTLAGDVETDGYKVTVDYGDLLGIQVDTSEGKTPTSYELNAKFDPSQVVVNGIYQGGTKLLEEEYMAQPVFDFNTSWPTDAKHPAKQIAVWPTAHEDFEVRYDVTVALPKMVHDRFDGKDRYEVSAKIVEELLPEKTDTSEGKPLFVVTGMVFSDGLSASPAAVKTGGAVALVHPTYTPCDELQKVIATKDISDLYIVGGESSVSPKVVEKLEELTGVKAQRIDGKDRYEVSLGVMTKFFPGVTDAMVVSGHVFSDALSASAPAGHHGMPVLLVNGLRDSLSPEAAAALSKVPTVTVVGGEATVSDGILTQLKAMDGVDAKRIGGADRYEVAVNVNKAFMAHDNQGVALASGLLFSDALPMAAYAGINGQPLYLVKEKCAQPGTVDAIDGRTHWERRIAGGSATVSDDLMVDALPKC